MQLHNNWTVRGLAHEADLPQDVSLYRLDTPECFNQYYVVSHEGTRRLMGSPEVIGYDSYLCMVPSTTEVLRYLRDKACLSSADAGAPAGPVPVEILTILRGGLNYPLEESCHHADIRVRNMDFLSCERHIENKQITGLDIKYEKMHAVDGATMLIGDILATGDTFAMCFSHVINFFHRNGGSIRRVIFFTIGGTRAIPLMEELGAEMKELWPEFEGISCIFHEGMFTVYTDKGVTGINVPRIDFGWQGGIVSPEFRRYVLEHDDMLFEKCIIYDGGARRYELVEHYDEVMEYWNGIKERAAIIDYPALMAEKIGHPLALPYDEWLTACGYTQLPAAITQPLYDTTQQFLARVTGHSLSDIADRRLSEFSSAADFL